MRVTTNTSYKATYIDPIVSTPAPTWLKWALTLATVLTILLLSGQILNEVGPVLAHEFSPTNSFVGKLVHESMPALLIIIGIMVTGAMLYKIVSKKVINGYRFITAMCDLGYNLELRDTTPLA